MQHWALTSEERDSAASPPRTPGGSRRVTFSRELEASFDGDSAAAVGIDGLGGLSPPEAGSLGQSVSLPDISAGEQPSDEQQERARRNQRNRRNRQQRRRHKKKSSTSSSGSVRVPGAVSGPGLPRVSRNASFEGLGLDYSALDVSGDFSFSSTLQQWEDDDTRSPQHQSQVTGGGRGADAGNLDSPPLPDAVMYMPTSLYTRSSDLIAAEQRYVSHMRHVSAASRMIDIKTPHGYRSYRQRHELKNGSQDSLHNWLARPGMRNSLAPLSKMTLPRPQARRSTSVEGVRQEELAMQDFYSQMAAIEQQMRDAPLCMAHKVMARLSPEPGGSRQLPVSVDDAAATRIQALARGKAARDRMAREAAEAAAAAAEAAERERAAALIQARVRGMQTRQQREIGAARGK